VKLLWLTALSCNGNAHSFLNYPYLDQFLKDFEFVYHPIIDSAYTLEDIALKSVDCDILLIEGVLNDFLKKADTPIVDIIKKYSKKAQKIVAVGTCASFGGIFFQGSDDRYGLHFANDKEHNRFEEIKNKTINVSGCPIHPEILVNTLYHIKNKMDIKLDKLLRPKEFYAYTVHNGCTRNEYFEYKIDNHKFGEFEGCMFYDHGCQAPFTHGSCNKILWNEINSKTRAGLPCMGCTEPKFPKNNLFTTKKNMGIPQELPIGVSKRAYLTLAGITKAFKIERLEKGLFDD
jgi:hydrogenase small subunit